MLVNGEKTAKIERVCVESMNMPLAEVKAAIIDAQKQITVAADYNRIEELGRAYIRLNDLYTTSIKGRDSKTALAAQKEINRLVGLYEKNREASPPVDGEPATINAEELAAIGAHLLPLNLAPADYPLNEHARIAAERIREHG